MPRQAAALRQAADPLGSLAAELDGCAVAPNLPPAVGEEARQLAAAARAFQRQPETAPAIPYVGTGVGYYDDGAVERVWPTFLLGFELPYQRGLRWLVEYHALDGLRRSRFLVGLAAGGR